MENKLSNNFPEIKHMRIQTIKKKKKRPIMKFQDNRNKEKTQKYSREKNLLIYK